MSITAKSRSSVHLSGSTALDPENTLAAIREGASSIKGGGASLVTTGLWNIGAQIVVVKSDATSLRLALTSGKRLIELCTFSAHATADSNGRTRVKVGGLETYKTQQEKLMVFIPIGPKLIPGMAPYKKFLSSVSQRITAADPSAVLHIAQVD